MFNLNDYVPATETKHTPTSNSLPGRNTMTRTMTTLRTLCAMTLIAGVALFTGCGTNLSPLGPEQPAAVSDQVIVRSTKPATDGTSTKTEKGGKGGTTKKKSGPAQFGGGE